jgi:predicted DNA-binding protein with PD1-like motif
LIFQETTRTRRLVGRIEKGEELVETLTELCRDNDVRAGQIQAVGALTQAEIARFDEASGEYKTVFSGEGSFDLISLTGNVSRLGDEVVLRLESLLSTMGPVAPQVLSGQLRSGRAASVEFVLEIFEDLAIERRLDSDSGRLDIRSIRRTEKAQSTPEARAPHQTADKQPAAKQAAEQPAAKPQAPSKSAPAERAEAPKEERQQPISGKGMSWSDAAGESAESRGDKAGAEKPKAKDIYAGVNMEEPLMEAGDVLEHPKLGNCRIMKVEDGEFAHVRLPRGRIRKLSLDIVDVEFDREENGRKVFKAVIGR